MKFADNRTDFVINISEIKKNDSVLTVGVAHIPEIEKLIELKTKKSNCIDLDSNKIEHAKKYAKKTNFIKGDITKQNLKLDNKFDTIIMLEVLEHLKNDYLALKNIRKMLKKNGKLIISVPNKHPLHFLNPLLYTQHERHYTLQELLEILKRSGFKIKYYNTVESPKLIIDLYVHLFCKYILRKSVKFAILTGKKDKTYLKNNSPSKGLDSLVVALKS